MNAYHNYSPQSSQSIDNYSENRCIDNILIRTIMVKNNIGINFKKQLCDLRGFNRNKPLYKPR